MGEITIERTPLVWLGLLYDVDGSRRWPQDDEWEVGAAFYGGFRLSDHYRAHVAAHREPITVLCPFPGPGGRVDGSPFCIDSAPTSDDRGHWDVTVDMDSLVVGAQPRITVQPSIHLVGFWHGWLTDGVLHQ